MSIEPDELREMRERCESATAGSWQTDDECRKRDGLNSGIDKYAGWLLKTDDNDPVIAVHVDHYDHVSGTVGDTDKALTDADAEFIAHARNDMPRLIDEVERLREAIGSAIGDMRQGNNMDALTTLYNAHTGRDQEGDQ